MKIEKVVVGSLKTNCYILEIDNKVLVIDPGDDYDLIKEVINNREVLAVLITHEHFDHVGALSNFKNFPIYKFNNLEEKSYTIGPFTFEVIFNPGHTNDCVSYYFKDYNVLFSGDFIFYHTIGRCDLPNSSLNDMLKSIDKIKKLSKNTIIYPGHGPNTSLEEELTNNYYF